MNSAPPGRERDRTSSSAASPLSHNTDPDVTTYENPRGDPCPSSSAPSVHYNHRDADDLISARRNFLRSVARDTISAINLGAVIVPDPQTEGRRLKYSIRRQTARTQANTLYFPPDARALCNWSEKERGGRGVPAVGQLRFGAGMGEPQKMRVSILAMSTLDGAQYLHSDIQFSPPFSKKVGVLNFASATSPGGGFIDGAQAQEESIARSSNLYVALITHIANPFYALHAKEDGSGYHSHAMIYTPDVLVFRDDTGFGARWRGGGEA